MKALNYRLLLKSFRGGSASKESACNTGDQCLIPGSRRFLQKGMATHSSILAWRMPGQSRLAGYIQFMGSQRVTNTHTHLKTLGRKIKDIGCVFK